MVAQSKMRRCGARRCDPVVRWAAVALAALLTACGGGNGDSDSPGNEPPPPPAADTTAPSVPQGVVATALSATEISIAWQPSTDTGTGVAGYRVFRDQGSTAVATVTSTAYTDTGLTAATQYAYTVRAFDGASPPNESASSQAATAQTQPTPDTDLSLTTQRVFSNLPDFDNPVLMLQAPGNGSTWHVVEQTGRIKAFVNDAAVTSTRLYIDIVSRVRSGGEMGLLGMAFHPAYPADPRVYLSYTHESSSGIESRIAEFLTRDAGQTLDPSSESILLTVPQPARNHNGGGIVFGPDGLLYIALGDGGGGGDTWGDFGNAQNLRTLLGKMVRIDVDGSTGAVPYGIPASNPYADNAPCNTGSGNEECPEILAYGFRNPWRWSFDRATGELWVADVGQSAREEVNRVVPGGNYGWRCFEGTQPYNADCGPNADTSLPPVAEYGRAAGQAITGGYVYRGTAIPALVGRYVFADYVSGNLWHIAGDTAPTTLMTANDGFATGLTVASFGEGNDGELYLVDHGGTLHRLRAGP
jgi:glucose/arabinose dehydrogenase